MLIKDVIQAVPTYCTSLFALPKALLCALLKMVQRFWLGNQQEDRKIQWMNWSFMVKSKAADGIEF